MKNTHFENLRLDTLRAAADMRNKERAGASKQVIEEAEAYYKKKLFAYRRALEKRHILVD